MKEYKLWKAKYKFWYQNFDPEIHERFVVTTGDSISDIEAILKGEYSYGKKYQVLEAHYMGGVILPPDRVEYRGECGLAEKNGNLSV